MPQRFTQLRHLRMSSTSFLKLFLFCFSFFYYESSYGQSGSYMFTAPVNTAPHASTSITMSYTIVAGVVTITFSPDKPQDVNPRIQEGSSYTTMTVSATNPLEFSYTLMSSTTSFFFHIEWASGGLFRSPSAITVLPIKLSDFSTTKNGDRSALLNWQTSSEINSDYFGIERSTDGTTWDQIGQVSAAGNSITDLSYSFVDAALPLNRTNGLIIYYRLKLTDLDGSYEYSDIRGLRLSSEISEVNIFPNPTSDRINIDLSDIDSNKGDGEVSIFSVTGCNLMSKKVNGVGIELLDISNLPVGQYHVIVKQGAETIHHGNVIKVD